MLILKASQRSATDGPKIGANITASNTRSCKVITPRGFTELWYTIGVMVSLIWFLLGACVSWVLWRLIPQKRLFVSAYIYSFTRKPLGDTNITIYAEGDKMVEPYLLDLVVKAQGGDLAKSDFDDGYLKLEVQGPEHLVPVDKLAPWDVTADPSNERYFTLEFQPCLLKRGTVISATFVSGGGILKAMQPKAKLAQTSLIDESYYSRPRQLQTASSLMIGVGMLILGILGLLASFSKTILQSMVVLWVAAPGAFLLVAGVPLLLYSFLLGWLRAPARPHYLSQSFTPVSYGREPRTKRQQPSQPESGSSQTTV